MKVIRYSIFETNSSSVHSMVILPSDVYKKWKNDGLYLKDDKLYTEEEVVEYLSQLRYYEQFKYNEKDSDHNEQKQKELYYSNYGFFSFWAWNPDIDEWGNYGLAEEEDYYKPNSLDKITIRSRFGYIG